MPSANKLPISSLVNSLVILFVCVVAFLAVPQTSAQDFTVNSPVDRVDGTPGDGRCDTGQQINGQPECTLRAAVQEASAVMSSAHVINIPSGTYTLSQTPSCQYLVNGNPNVQTASALALCVRGQVTLKGAGADTTIFDGANLGRMIFISADATATISGLTIQKGNRTGGSFEGGGGGVSNQGTLTITDSNFNANNDSSAGGAVYNNSGTLTIHNSVFTANTAQYGGGAIYSTDNGTLSITNSAITYNTVSNGNGGGLFVSNSRASVRNTTFANNTAGYGGALYAGYSPSAIFDFPIVNTTFANNHANTTGGAVFVGNFASMTFRNVTVAYNTSGSYAGGIYSNGNDTSRHLALNNTIIAGNTASDHSQENCSGTFFGNGYNLIGAQSELSQGSQQQKLCHVQGAATNQLGVDAQMGSLAYNGGVGQTVGLQAGSPAIDAGSPAPVGESDPTTCPVFDQKGYLRPQGAACDLGALERSKNFQITKVQPAVASNQGFTMVSLSGDGFAAGASIKLSRSGAADLIASDVTVDPAGSSAATFIDLTGVAEGAWDVTLTNADGSSVNLPAALTIGQPLPRTPWSLLAGPLLVRPDVPSTYTVLYGNDGNTEADAVPIQISIPAGFDIAFPSVATPPQQTGQVSTDWTRAGFDARVTQTGALRTFLFLAPAIPSQARLTFGFRLIPRNVGEGDKFQLNVEVGDPYYVNGSVSPTILNQIVTGAQGYAQNTLHGTLTQSAAARMSAYAASQLDLEVQAGRSALASSVQGSPIVYALPQNTQDIAEYGLAQSGALPAIADSFSPMAMLRDQLHPRAGNPFYAQTPRCSGTVLAEGTSCTDPYNPPPTPKDPLLCALLAATDTPTSAGECSPSPRKGCPNDANCRSGTGALSVDPNGKYGQSGVGTEQYLPSGNPMNYLITFENKPTASAPAATVTVTDQLDVSTLDLSTFSFGPLGFGNYKLTPPPNVTSFDGALDLRPTQNVLVQVQASLNTSTGQLKWVFTSLAPDTQAPITSATEGFLPPNTAPPNGDGYVSFNLYPRSPADGKKICNQASIVFDTNAPILTENWCNSYDDSAPVSKVTALAANQSANTFAVSWSGTDAGSGIATYNVYVSDNGGAFTLWQSAVTTTSANYTGTSGHTYGFYSAATDKLGHVESKSQADTSTRIGPAAAPAVTLSASALSFGSINVGSSSSAQALTLTNSGNASLSLIGITLAGTNASQFVQSNSCGATLAAGASCSISITFRPTTAGAITASIAIADNAANSPQTASLSGTGVALPPADFTISATPTSQSVTRGSSATFTIQLVSTASSNPFTGGVTLTATGLPSGATATFSPASVVPGATQAATSTMTIAVPTQTSRNDGFPGWGFGIGSTSLASMLLLWRRRRLPSRLYLALLACTLAGTMAALTGCGNSGTKPPATSTPTTSAITVTGTSGATVHTTTVMLTTN